MDRDRQMMGWTNGIEIDRHMHHDRHRHTDAHRLEHSKYAVCISLSLPLFPFQL